MPVVNFSLVGGFVLFSWLLILGSNTKVSNKLRLIFFRASRLMSSPCSYPPIPSDIANNVNGFGFGFGVSWQMMKLSSFCGCLLVSLRLYIQCLLFSFLLW